MFCDWDQITTEAYLTLLKLDIKSFPIPNRLIECKGAKIVSYQEYANVVNRPVSDIACECDLADAFLIRGIRPGLTIILYNAEVFDKRMKYSLWHEIGHIKCNHQKHGDQEEIEANYFASQVIAPNALIHEIARRGYTITLDLLVECFGLSKEAAKKKKTYIGKYGYNHTNDNDDLVRMQFSSFLNSKYPPISQNYYDSYYDELDREREKWAF